MILESLYFFLPGFIANASLPLFKKIKYLDFPLDFNIKSDKQNIIGKHKTFKGLILALIISTVIFLFQKQAYLSGFKFGLIDYSNTNILLGVFRGAGIILGDLVKSFLKRKQRLSPGKAWIPFDQIDYTIGGLLLSSIIFLLNIYSWCIIIFFGAILSPIFHYAGFILNVNKDKI